MKGCTMLELKVITEDQAKQTIDGIFRILEEIGAEIQQKDAVALLKNAGCEVDGNRVKIPRSLVEKCLESAPSVIDIYDRKGELAMSLGERNVYFGPGPTCPSFRDARTGERRPARKRDAADTARVADALSNIDYVMSLCMIADEAKGLADVHEIHAMIQNTTKPLCGWAFDASNAQSIIDMCAAVRGGLDALREKPLFILYCEPTSPLVHTEEAVEILMLCAKNGIPCVYTPGMMMGATAPATIPATITMGLAESLTGLVIAQLVNKGAPMICAAPGGPMDMKTMNHSYGAPDFYLLNSIGAEVTHALGLPTWHTAGCTDSKAIDAQAASEAMMGIICALGSGGNLVHDVGFTDLGMTGSIEQLVICDEIISMARHLYKGVEFSEDTFAFDTIEKVGPGGNFLLEDHTLDHYSDVWYPVLGDRNPWGKWMENGGLDMTQRARVEIRKILDSHTVEPLSAEVIDALDAIVERAERSFGE